MRTVGDERRFDWDALVPPVAHPTRVAIIEALLWIRRPLSPPDLVAVLADEALSLSRVAYYVRTLVEAEVLAQVGEHPNRGSLDGLYALAPR